MKRKTLLMALAALATVGLAGCGGDGGKYDATVKADPDRVWVMHGNYLLADGETQNGWNAKENSLYEASKMTATSVQAISEYAPEVADLLKEKSIKYLYEGEAVFGMNDAGWNTNFLRDGKLYSANGSCAFKAAACLYDAADDVYAEDQWISDPKTAHAESLTPETFFMPQWSEQPDFFGFSWGSNPVVVGGAGRYKMIVAQYTDVSAANVPGYGIAAVKVEDLSEAEGAFGYSEVPTFDHTAHTYGVVGSFAASNWGANPDVAMTSNGDGTYTAEVALLANEEFKVRADGAWDLNWAPTAPVDGVITIAEGGNAVAAVDGTYVVTIGNFGAAGTATVTVSLKA